MPPKPQLIDYIYPEYNGVHFLAQPATNASALHLVHSIVDFYNTQRGWSQSPPVPHNTMFHIVDLASAEPDHIYMQLTHAFAVPEYFGFSHTILYKLLTDLSWLNSGFVQLNHVLLLRAKTNIMVTAVSKVLSEVAAFWRAKYTAFLVFVVETTGLLADHGFPERFRL
jgi:hypothetical protein